MSCKYIEIVELPEVEMSGIFFDDEDEILRKFHDNIGLP